MRPETHSQLANFIWSICNLLRGPYKRNEYRKVILPLTVLRRFDCLLAPTKSAVLEEYPVIKKKPETVVRSLLQKITKRPCYNLSKLDFPKLLNDPNQLAPNLNSYINQLNSEPTPILYGQDWNDDAWAVCKSDMLIKGEDADNIILGDTFSKDGFPDEKFDYMLANPPFGVEWKQQQRFIEQERDTLGFQGRFGAGTPRVNDGSLLFLQHMLSKMRDPKKGGSRIAIVFNGSPLFTGDAGSGESEIRRWIIENDWLEAIVALPDQIFYNTGIFTYLWILTNRKGKARRGKIQLIDARNFWIPMRKSLGNKRHKIGDRDAGERDDIGEITRIYGNFQNGETRKLNVDGATKELVVSKIFDNEDFG